MTDGEVRRPICFVIMPISDASGYEAGHFGRVYEHILKPSISNAGYTAVRADDTNKTDYIVVGIIKQIIESDMVLCDFSAKNPNVMYELGIRHAFNRPVTLVKDRQTDKVFDIQGLRYTDYDQSLRIDSVQKDIDKITKAIQETAAADPGNVNSVVQLAGMKAAEIPADRTVSPDTQLILAELSTLRQRLDGDEYDPKGQRYFRILDDKVMFDDNTEATLNEDIFDSKKSPLGKLIEIHPVAGRIFIKDLTGKVTPYSASSIKSRGLSTMPF